jgi:hypothetical protein
LKKPGIGKRIIFKRILIEIGWEGMTVFMWLRIGASVGLL